MKMLSMIIVIHLLLFVKDAKPNSSTESKQVVCFYNYPNGSLNGTFGIGAIDASICTHLMVDEMTFKAIAEEYRMQNESMRNLSSVSILQEFKKLKEANPDLKVIQQFTIWFIGEFRQMLEGSWENRVRGENITKETLWFLQEAGMDGLEFNMEIYQQDALDVLADELCGMLPEFRKHGYIFTISLAERHWDYGGTTVMDKNVNYSRIASCCDHVKVFDLKYATNVTQRLSSLNRMKSTLKTFIEKGLPTDKIVLTVPAFGNLFTLYDPQDTGLGAKINVTRSAETGNSLRPGFISHQDLLILMKNSSFEWRIHRDEETKEPFAFTETGLWATYDDITSMEAKATYVLENGLRGIAIFPLNAEDSEGIGGERKFPLTRAVYNTFQTGLNQKKPLRG